jgi:hypothetical protein
MAEAASRPHRGGGPRLDGEEWILLLDIFHRHGSHANAGLDAELAHASALLAARAAGRSGVRTGVQVRSVEGLRRRLVELQMLSRGVRSRAPKAAQQVWERYGQDPVSCKRAALEIGAGAGRGSRYNPDWTREETLLALAAYLRIRPAFASRESEAISDLSAQLRRYGIQRGVSATATFRNIDGVARKVDKFRAAEADLPPSRVKGALLEYQLWREFIERPTMLLAEARALAQRIAQDDLDIIVAGTPSRGPAPFFGITETSRSDGPMDLYLFLLCGPVERLYPAFDPARTGIFKIGRSNDIGRRLEELNLGFPPGCGLFWHAYDRRSHASGREAHAAEQKLLTHLAGLGRTLGGEFVMIDLAGASNVLDNPVAEVPLLASPENCPV